MSQNYYDILEVSSTANELTIRRAYRRLALMHHPDKNPTNEDESSHKFDEIRRAYTVLSNTDRRKAYDKSQKHKNPSENSTNVITTAVVLKPGNLKNPDMQNQASTTKRPDFQIRKTKSFPLIKKDRLPNTDVLLESLKEYNRNHMHDEMFSYIYKGTEKGEKYKRMLEKEKLNKYYYGRYYFIVEEAERLAKTAKPRTDKHTTPKKTALLAEKDYDTTKDSDRENQKEDILQLNDIPANVLRLEPEMNKNENSGHLNATNLSLVLDNVEDIVKIRQHEDNNKITHVKNIQHHENDTKLTDERQPIDRDNNIGRTTKLNNFGQSNNSNTITKKKLGNMKQLSLSHNNGTVSMDNLSQKENKLQKSFVKCFQPNVKDNNSQVKCQPLKNKTNTIPSKNITLFVSDENGTKKYPRNKKNVIAVSTSNLLLGGRNEKANQRNISISDRNATVLDKSFSKPNGNLKEEITDIRSRILNSRIHFENHRCNSKNNNILTKNTKMKVIETNQPVKSLGIDKNQSNLSLVNSRTGVNNSNNSTKYLRLKKNKSSGSVPNLNNKERFDNVSSPNNDCKNSYINNRKFLLNKNDLKIQNMKSSEDRFDKHIKNVCTNQRETRGRLSIENFQSTNTENVSAKYLRLRKQNTSSTAVNKIKLQINGKTDDVNISNLRPKNSIIVLENLQQKQNSTEGCIGTSNPNMILKEDKQISKYSRPSTKDSRISLKNVAMDKQDSHFIKRHKMQKTSLDNLVINDKNKVSHEKTQQMIHKQAAVPNKPRSNSKDVDGRCKNLGPSKAVSNISVDSFRASGNVCTKTAPLNNPLINSNISKISFKYRTTVNIENSSKTKLNEKKLCPPNRYNQPQHVKSPKHFIEIDAPTTSENFRAIGISAHTCVKNAQLKTEESEIAITQFRGNEKYNIKKDLLVNNIQDDMEDFFDMGAYLAKLRLTEYDTFNDNSTFDITSANASEKQQKNTIRSVDDKMLNTFTKDIQ